MGNVQTGMDDPAAINSALQAALAAISPQVTSAPNAIFDDKLGSPVILGSGLQESDGCWMRWLEFECSGPKTRYVRAGADPPGRTSPAVSQPFWTGTSSMGCGLATHQAATTIFIRFKDSSTSVP